MRMSAGTRVLLSIFLLVIIAALAYVLCVMFGVAAPEPLEGVFATALRGGFWYKFLYAAIIVVLIVVALILLFFRSKREGGEDYSEHQRTITISKLQNGDIVMTTKAVEELIQREVEQTSGVRSSTVKVLSSGDYVDVVVHMAIRHGEVIPDVTKALHDRLDTELVNQLGVTPREIDITVTDISDAAVASPPSERPDKRARRVI